MSLGDPPELSGADLIGLRVSCYWDGEDKFYSGVVRDYVKNKYKPYFVCYDDGEECWEPRKNMQVITKFPRGAKRKSLGLSTSTAAATPSSASAASRRPSSAHSSSSSLSDSSAAQRAARDARRARSPLPARPSSAASVPTSGASTAKRIAARTASGSKSSGQNSRQNKRRGSGDSGGSSSSSTTSGLREGHSVSHKRTKLIRGSSKQTGGVSDTASVSSIASNSSRRSRQRYPVRNSNNSDNNDNIKPGSIRHHVGQAVKVFWEGDETWYHGTVKSVRRSGHVVVLYKDDEEAEEKAGDVIPIGEDDDAVDRSRDALSLKTSPGVAGHKRRRESRSGPSSNSESRTQPAAGDTAETRDGGSDNGGGGDSRRKRRLSKRSASADLVVERNSQQQSDGTTSGESNSVPAAKVPNTCPEVTPIAASNGSSSEKGEAKTKPKKLTRSNSSSSGRSKQGGLEIDESAKHDEAKVKKEETKSTTESTTTAPVSQEQKKTTTSPDSRFHRGTSNLDWTVQVLVNEANDDVGECVHNVTGCVLTYDRTRGYLVIFRYKNGMTNEDDTPNLQKCVSKDAKGGTRAIQSDEEAEMEEWGLVWINDETKINFLSRTSKGAGRAQVATALKRAPEAFTNRLVTERIAPVGMHIQLLGHNRIRPLAVCAMRGHMTTVRSLIKLGADPTRNGSDGNSAFMWACRYGQCQIIRELLAAKNADADDVQTGSGNGDGDQMKQKQKQQERLVDINAENKQGLTALMVAAIAGQAKVVGTLIELGADLDIVDAHAGKSALMHACAAQQLETAAALVAAGASVGAEAQAMSSLVQHAMMTGQRDLARDLWSGMVKRRKKPNDALWMAVQSNVVEFVRDLLDTGEDPNRSVQGKFPLMEAIELDNATIVGALLDAGATLTQTVNAEGQSLFAWACGRNLSSEVVRRLIRAATEQQQKSSSTVATTSVKAEAQTDPTTTNPVKPESGASGSTSSSSGSGSSTSGGGSSSGQSTTLCSKGWSSLLQDGLMNAIEANQEETVAEMVRAGVPMDEHHENGWTALMQACFHGRARIAKRLIDAGAAVNHTNVSGQSALMFACVAGHDAVAKVLVDYKVDCNVTDSGGLSPLMWAIRFCRQEVVNTLIAGGADVNHKVLK